MQRNVEFYFDVGSPAAYLAWTQMPALCKSAGGTLEYRPMLLGGVFQATGNQSPMNIPAKSAYMKEDLARFAQRYGVPFRHNPHFPINTLMLMRSAAGLQLRDPDKLVPYVDAVYRAIWVDGKDMNDPQVVASVLEQAGFDAGALTAIAVGRGVFGAPAFFIGGQLYWGQDRLDFVKQALETPS